MLLDQRVRPGLDVDLPQIRQRSGHDRFRFRFVKIKAPIVGVYPVQCTAPHRHGAFEPEPFGVELLQRHAACRPCVSEIMLIQKIIQLFLGVSCNFFLCSPLCFLVDPGVPSGIFPGALSYGVFVYLQNHFFLCHVE